jgi:DNA-binding beta-propeller fold protein YncE
MMCAVRRFLGLVAAVVALVAAPPGAAGSTTGDSPLVLTVLGPATVEAPSGIALDTAGDLFVADTGHCRVLVVPAHAGTSYGVRLRPGHAAIVAGGSCSGAGSIGHPSGVTVDARGDVYIAEATAQRVQVVRPDGPRTVVTVAGHVGDRGGRPLRRERSLPLHEHVMLYDVHVVPLGGVTPLTRYDCTSSRTHAL